MNILDKFSELEINSKILDEKKQQTAKKIEYVRDYIVRWAEISAVRADVKVITFIDCMCNAGVYKDGDCCTAIEVLSVFCSIADRYPHKVFRVICNDKNSAKVDILKRVASYVKKDCKNVRVNTANLDVNECLDVLVKNPRIGGRQVFGYECSTVLYVDP